MVEARILFPRGFYEHAKPEVGQLRHLSRFRLIIDEFFRGDVFRLQQTRCGDLGLLRRLPNTADVGKDSILDFVFYAEIILCPDAVLIRIFDDAQPLSITYAVTTVWDSSHCCRDKSSRPRKFFPPQSYM